MTGFLLLGMSLRKHISPELDHLNAPIFRETGIKRIARDLEWLMKILEN